MKLSEMLAGLDHRFLQQTSDPELTDVAYDTRKLTPGCAFVCIRGAKLDSHALAAQAAEQGAAALIVEHAVDAPADIPVVQVADTRIALAEMAANFFGHPARQLKTVGITGTKGKTTTTYLLKAILEEAGHKTGLIGSIGALIGTEPVKTINTTPESYELQKLFRRMVDEGCEYAVMEVSSQGLMLHRTAGVTFDVGIFLNISRDHISPWEHQSLEEYLHCKSLLFRQCRLGILNRDDAHFDAILDGHTCAVETFGFDRAADTRVDMMETVKAPGYMGVHYTTIGRHALSVTVGSPGKFSVYDSLAAICAAEHFGISSEVYNAALHRVKIRGRVETIDIPAPYSVIIDFAHDGIGIQSLIDGLHQYQPNHIIAVFGSDGNRTKIRRADAGEILGKCADYTIVTSNCPRFEPLDEINAEIQVGLDRTDGKYEIIPDRRTAIKHAMAMAEPDDMILLIGKGHWDYEEINGVKYPFDERVVVKELFRELQAERRTPTV